MRTGSCNCGGVRFEIAGEMPAASVCHCGQCRRQSGHVWASTHVPDDQLTLTAQEGLRWYRSSDRAQRGFCGTCGSFLFWKAEGEAATSIAASAEVAPPLLDTLIPAMAPSPPEPALVNWPETVRSVVPALVNASSPGDPLS